MIPWIKALLYDPQSFANFVRAGLFALGSLPEVVDLGAAPWWIGKLLMIASLLVKAGDKNPPMAVAPPVVKQP